MPPGSGLASRISTSCPKPPQVVRARQARRAGADDEHALAGGRPGRDRPALLVGEIAEKPVERMDRDGRIEELPVAGAFARVITRAAVRAGQRVLLHVLPPRPLVVAGLRQGEPGLDVLPGRTGVVAGRKMIDVDGALPSARAGALADRLLVDRRQILRNETHGCLHALVMVWERGWCVPASPMPRMMAARPPDDRPYDTMEGSTLIRIREPYTGDPPE